MARKANSGRGGKSRRGGARGERRRSTRPAERDLFAIDNMVRIAVRGGAELLTVDDPLDAEHWASAVLGTVYKLPAPFEVREKLERSLGSAIVQSAERQRNAAGMAVLCALAGITGDEIGAREAAARMAARGVPRPSWADIIGKPEFLGGFAVTDPFGDQVGYYLTYRYTGRRPHMVMALYDENLGGIIKDAFAAEQRDGADVRTLLAHDPDVTVRDADPAEAATRVTHAIATGDQFVDNDWTPEFKQTRALLLARMRLLPTVALPEPAEPPDDDARDALIAEFLASSFASKRDETVAIVDHCLIARCDFGDGDPLRWSPTVVEMFMLDYLPRKVSLSPAQIDAAPEVLTAWVRFALTKRGIDERFVAEAEEAVQGFTEEFRAAMGNADNFGPAKAIMRALRADGVDMTDQKAVSAWLAEFNALPDEERERFFGGSLDI